MKKKEKNILKSLNNATPLAVMFGAVMVFVLVTIMFMFAWNVFVSVVSGLPTLSFISSAAGVVAWFMVRNLFVKFNSKE